jgi:hypothetical protein
MARLSLLFERRLNPPASNSSTRTVADRAFACGKSERAELKFGSGGPHSLEAHASAFSDAPSAPNRLFYGLPDMLRRRACSRCRCDEIGYNVTDQANGLVLPKRAVSLRRDKDEFVISSWPHDVVIFRNRDAEALRKACVSFAGRL